MKQLLNFLKDAHCFNADSLSLIIRFNTEKIIFDVYDILA